MKLIKHFVDGKIISGSSDRKNKVTNPATGTHGTCSAPQIPPQIHMVPVPVTNPALGQSWYQFNVTNPAKKRPWYLI